MFLKVNVFNQNAKNVSKTFIEAELRYSNRYSGPIDFAKFSI